MVVLFFFQFQQLVVSGDLPCTRDEAATLAGIALHVDEAWPDTDTESLRQDNNQDEYERDRLLKDDASDAKNKRKEIDVSHRTRKMASSRRRGKLTKQLFCLDCDSVKLCGGSKDNHLLKYLPPEYQSSRRVRDLIQVSQITVVLACARSHTGESDNRCPGVCAISYR